MLVNDFVYSGWLFVFNLGSGVFDSECESSASISLLVFICLLLFFGFGKFFVQVSTI